MTKKRYITAPPPPDLPTQGGSYVRTPHGVVPESARDAKPAPRNPRRRLAPVTTDTPSPDHQE
jgi:hypothetical protein